MRKVRAAIGAAAVVSGTIVLVLLTKGSRDGSSAGVVAGDIGRVITEGRTASSTGAKIQQTGPDGCALMPPHPLAPQRTLDLDMQAVSVASAAAGGRQLGSIAIMGIAHNVSI